MASANGEFGMFAALFDESTILKQIQGTHNAPVADCNNVDVTPILTIIEDVLNCAAPSNEGEPSKDNTSEAVKLGETLASIIQKVSSEITCKCFAGDVHTTTMTLLRMLSSYEWGAKVAIALGALAIAYGDFRLVVQSFSTEPTDSLAKSVAKLKQLPQELKTKSEILEPWFKKLILTMLGVTKTIMKFKQEMSPVYIAPKELPLCGDITQISKATYLTITSVVVCASQIANLIGNSYEHTTSTTDDVQELSKLCAEKERLHKSLIQQLKLFTKRKDEKMQLEEYNKLVIEFTLPERDNIKILRRLINRKDDTESKPLYKGSTKKSVHVDEVLQGKTILLLLISDLKPFDEELDIMNRIYNKDSLSKPDDFQYEIVWVPVIDEFITNWKEDFEKIQKKMSWYTLNDPKVLEPAVIRYIKEEWNFSKETILVVLDAKGNVACDNAFNRYLIWGNKAISSIAKKDNKAQLSDEDQGPIDLFFKGIEHTFDEWISDGKYVCVYGGGDLLKIKEFSEKAMKLADSFKIKLNIIYAGKSNETKKTRAITEAIIRKEVLGVNATDNMRHFWVKLKWMLYSKSQPGKNVKDDLIMQHVIDVLSSDGSDQVWAMWFVSDEMTSATGGEMISLKGDAVLNSVTTVNEWARSKKLTRVIPALKDYLEKNPISEPHCNKIVVPGDKGRIPKIVHCGCGKEMKMYFTYCCCTD